MPLSRRRSASSINIWPGFVDALTQLTMVIVFVLLIFTVGQFYLSGAVSDRDMQIKKLNAQIAEIGAMLSMQQATDKDLRNTVTRLTAQLQATLAERDALARDKDALSNTLAETQNDASKKDEKIAADQAQLDKEQADIAMLNQNVLALQQQLAAIAKALDLSNLTIKAKEAQIADLGTKLNLALAKRVEDLANYRSEFFGKLREILGNRPDIRIVGDRFVFQSEVLFAPASDQLTPDARQSLMPIVAALHEIEGKIPANIHWILEIEGHTDATPIKSAKFQSNWELSTARAASVVKFLIDHGVPPDHLAAAGYGEFQPLDSATTPDAYRKNRRIEIKLTQR